MFATILSFLPWIPRLIGLIPFSFIEKQSATVSAERIAAMQAKTEDEKTAASERVRMAELKLDALTKAREYQSVRVIQFMFGMVAWLVIAKILVWDKVLGWGVTDPLSKELWAVIMVILGGFFYISGKGPGR